MATELGKAYVQIMPSAKGIKGAIEGQLDGEVTSAGTNAGNKLGGLLGNATKLALGATVAGIGAIIAGAINEGAKLQQSLGGVETLFKESADKVKGYAEEAYRTTGLSANAYMENVTGFSASLLQSVSGDTNKAADIANMAMIDMSDNANKMGTSMESIQNAYQGFAKQNYTMLDNLKLGYSGTKQEMQRLLADAQKLTGVKYDINNLSDVYSAIHAIQGKLDITGTTAKEAASTFSGSFSAMTAAAQNVLGKLALGQDVGPALESLFETTSTFLFSNLLPMVWNVVKEIPKALANIIIKGIPNLFTAGMDLVKGLTEGIGNGFPDIKNIVLNLLNNFQMWLHEKFPQIMQSGVELLSQLGLGILQAFPNIWLTINQILQNLMVIFLDFAPTILQGGVDLILSLIDGIVQSAPNFLSSFGEIIAGLITALEEKFPEFVSKGWEIITSLISGLIDRLPSLIATGIQLMIGLAKTIITRLPDFIKMGIDIIANLIKGVVEYIPKLIGKIANMGSEIIKEVGKINLLDAGKAIIDGFLRGLKSAWKGVTDFVGGIAKWIADHKGPISYDKVLLIPAGKAIMQGLNKGLEDNFKTVKRTVGGMANDISKVMNDSLNSDMFDNSFATTSTIQHSLRRDSLLIGPNQNYSSEYATDSMSDDIIIENVIVLDGKVLGRHTAKFVNDEIKTQQKIQNRMYGILGG